MVLRLTSMLRQLETERENISLLVALQRDLIRLIRGAERRIAKLRADVTKETARLKNARLPKDQAKQLKKRITRLKGRVEKEQYLKFIWKCFGDGIAFIYIDKFSLKHPFYSTEDYSPKQEAGALSGKEGFKLEWQRVKEVAKAGIPAMLCDITNMLRQGDVCALIGPDPMLAEMKSSGNINKRTKRQRKSLEALGAFYAKDEARDFHGLPHTRRVEIGVPEVTHIDTLNACIKDSEGKSMSFIAPEPGLKYFCIRDIKE